MRLGLEILIIITMVLLLLGVKGIFIRGMLSVGMVRGRTRLISKKKIEGGR